MGFFDFLKKIFIEEQKTEIEKEVSLESSRKKIEDKSIELKNKAKKLISETIILLQEKIVDLKAFDLEKRRENEQLKKVVRESLEIYIFNLEKFLNGLKESDFNADANNYLGGINKSFNNFTKNSSRIYQKANILVGKELGAINSAIKNFRNEYEIILRENSENNLRLTELKEREEIIEKISNFESIERQIESALLEFHNLKTQNQEKIIKQTEEKERILKSSDYEKDIEKKRQINKEIEYLKNEISKFMESVNLKELAKIYHSDEKRHEVIQKYRENYKRAIEEDKENKFGEIIKSSLGLNINLFETNEKIKELGNYVSQLDLKVKEIEQEILDLERQISEIDKTKLEEGKKLEKFRLEKEELKKSLEIKN